MLKDIYIESAMFKRERMNKYTRRNTRVLNNQPKILFPNSIEREYKKKISEYIKSIESVFFDEFLSGDFKSRLSMYADSPLSDDLSSSESVVLSFVNNELKPNMSEYLENTSRNISVFNKNQHDKVFNYYTGVPILIDNDAAISNLLDNWENNNNSLISGLSDEYIKKVNTAIVNGVREGKTASNIKDNIRKIGSNLSENRAKLIARDQVASLNSDISKTRQMNAGIKMYRWSTSEDERVRGNPSGLYPNALPSHYDMEGILCRWDNPNVYSVDDGETWKQRRISMPFVHPGVAINCRCVGEPYFDDDIKNIDRQIGDDVQYTNINNRTEYKQFIRDSGFEIDIGAEYFDRKIYKDLDNIGLYRVDSAGINNYLLGNIVDMPNSEESALKDQIKGIRSYIKNIGGVQSNVIFYRGIATDTPLDIWIGAKVKNKTFFSVSAQERIAKKFAEEYGTGDNIYILRLKTKSGSKFAPVVESYNKEKESVTFNSDELEFLAVDGTSFEVTNISHEKVGSRMYYYVDGVVE